MSTTTRMTFAEFEKLSNGPGKQELLNGELIELPPAKWSHTGLVMRVALFLAKVTGESRVKVEAGYRIGDGWLVPDVSVSWPDQKVVGGYAVESPMIAIEIASPSNTDAQIDEKTVAYLENGAAEVWIFYPKTRSMMVHVRADMSARRYTGKYECALLNATIPVAELLS
jgi:Uma2 family endonuclease